MNRKRMIEAIRIKEELDRREDKIRFEYDFPYYAEKCLVIRPKDGGKVPFILNRAQKYTHEKIEEQLIKKELIDLDALRDPNYVCTVSDHCCSTALSCGTTPCSCISPISCNSQ